MFNPRRFACLILCATLLAGQSHPACAQQSETVQILDAVKAFVAEGRLLSMRVEIQTEDFSDGKWISSAPLQKASVTLEPVFGARFRIEYDPICAAWINGAAPFAGEHKIVAYDGRVVRTVHLETGPAEAMFPDRNATIEDLNLDISEKYRYYSGVDFFAPLAKYVSGEYGLHDSLTAGVWPKISVDGDRVVIDNDFSASLSERFEFDKKRGHVLLKHTWNYKPQGLPPSSSEYLPGDFQQIADFGWVPTTGVLTTNSQGKISRATYKFANATVSKLDGDAVFKPNVPAGYTFEDKRLKLKFKVGVTGQALIDSIRSTTQDEQ